jgi:hypothetical protein
VNARAEAGEGKGASAKRPGTLRLGAVLAIAAVIAVAAFLLLRDDDDEAAPGQETPAAAVETNAPEVVSVGTLRRKAANADQPLYWAGPRSGRKYEITETPDGSRTYVRYLPPSAKAGVEKPYLTVAAYRKPNAFQATKAVADQPGSTKINIAGGGIAFYAAEHPTSVYVAYPKSAYQIEVFHPRANVSHRLVRTGQVRPIADN